MGVRQAGRRRIVVAGRRFAWYVREVDGQRLLHVLSEDKHWLVTYHLGEPGEPFLVCLGVEPRDPGVREGCWRRFRCPRWEEPAGTMTPAGVRRMIEWLLAPTSDRIAVDFRGVAIGGQINPDAVI